VPGASAISRRAPPGGPGRDPGPGPGRSARLGKLLGDGSVRRLHLSIGDVNEAYLRSGNAAAADNPEPGDPDDVFIELFLAPSACRPSAAACSATRNSSG